MRIDAHHHFWKYEGADFPWIDDSCPQLARNFTAEDFATVLSAANVDGSVLIQCLQTAQETAMMFDQARLHDWIRGVVGWFPLTAPNVGDVLDAALQEEPKLCGARHILQGTPPDRFFKNPAFGLGLEALATRDLVYDLLVNEPQLAHTLALVDEHPDLRFVLDHLGKPDIRVGAPSWLEPFRELAKRPNVVAAKLSGLPMEADWTNWTARDLAPYFDAALEYFGPSRLMFASDWPPCLTATSYQRWLEVIEETVAPLTPTEQAEIWSGTATRAYRLKPPAR